MKSTLLTIFLMTALVGSAQINLNDYKYVVVPKRFDGFKKENQHQTSTLIKYLLTKKGFVTVYEDNLPVDLTSDRCLGLFLELINNSSMFTTKTALALKDCNNQEVFITQEGKSKEKDYRESYNEAISEAFESFNAIDYSYEPKEGAKEAAPITVSFKNDVKTVKDAPKLEAKQDPMVEEVATKDVQYYKDRRPVESDYKKADDTSVKKSVEEVATKTEQSYESIEPVESNAKIENPVSSAKIIVGILYAQEIPNGYQLVDSTPKIQLKIFKSSMPNVYIAKGDDRDGVVYTSDGKWFFEHYEGEQVIQEELDIKF